MKKFLLLVIVLSFSGQVQALNDPMKPPFFDGESIKENASPKNKPLMLSMVLLAKKRKVAVLDGKMVSEGESVSGYRVLRIDTDHVVVSRKGKVKEIFLGKPQQRDKTKIDNRNKSVEG